MPEVFKCKTQNEIDDSILKKNTIEKVTDSLQNYGKSQVKIMTHEDKVIAKTFITEKGLSSGIGDNLSTFRVAWNGALFYTKNELGTNRHYNVGNRAFWAIIVNDECM